MEVLDFTKEQSLRSKGVIVYGGGEGERKR